MKKIAGVLIATSIPALVAYELEETATYEDLFNALKEDRYFPNVSGNNVVWVLTTPENYCVFSYFTLTEKFSMG